MILLSNAEALRATLGGSFILLRLGMRLRHILAQRQECQIRDLVPKALLAIAPPIGTSARLRRSASFTQGDR